jgi:hypothetical protein
LSPKSAQWGSGVQSFTYLMGSWDFLLWLKRTETNVDL